MKGAINFIAFLLLLLLAAMPVVATAQTPEPEPEPEPVVIGPAAEAVVPAAPAAKPASPAVAPIPAASTPLAIVRDFAEYQRLALAEPNKALVDISTLGLPVDVKYATDGNFMKKKLYPVAKAYLRAPVARALAAANAELQKGGYTLVVWDAYRPHRVTVEMWEKIRNPDYVADPAQGSRHNRGAAVDVTLESLHPTVNLYMGTNYDDFSPRASHAYTRLHPETLAYRKMLRDVMDKHGFDAFPTEWWHYDFRGWDKYEVMDVGLDELAAKTASPSK